MGTIYAFGDKMVYELEKFCTDIYLIIGTYAVLNNLQIHFEPCIHKEFQPFILFSNETYKCIYNKGLCTETGQVIFSNGTASTNRYCQCDYRKGFSFVIKPKQNCYCDQSREDCTCVSVDCENDKQLNSGKYLSKYRRFICNVYYI